MEFVTRFKVIQGDLPVYVSHYKKKIVTFIQKQSISTAVVAKKAKYSWYRENGRTGIPINFLKFLDYLRAFIIQLWWRLHHKTISWVDLNFHYFSDTIFLLNTNLPGKYDRKPTTLNDTFAKLQKWRGTFKNCSSKTQKKEAKGNNTVENF